MHTLIEVPSNKNNGNEKNIYMPSKSNVKKSDINNLIKHLCNFEMITRTQWILVFVCVYLNDKLYCNWNFPNLITNLTTTDELSKWHIKDEIVKHYPICISIQEKFGKSV